MNVFTFSGNLGKDAEVRHLQSGTAVCSFSVAVRSGYGDNEKTTWVRCALFGKRAEGGLVQYLKKGVQVVVSGELSLNEYQTGSGESRSSIDVRVSEIDLMSRTNANQAGSQTEGHTQQQSAPTQLEPSHNDFDDEQIPF